MKTEPPPSELHHALVGTLLVLLGAADICASLVSFSVTPLIDSATSFFDGYTVTRILNKKRSLRADRMLIIMYCLLATAAGINGVVRFFYFPIPPLWYGLLLDGILGVGINSYILIRLIKKQQEPCLYMKFVIDTIWNIGTIGVGIVLFVLEIELRVFVGTPFLDSGWSVLCSILMVTQLARYWSKSR